MAKVDLESLVTEEKSDTKASRLLTKVVRITFQPHAEKCHSVHVA